VFITLAVSTLVATLVHCLRRVFPLLDPFTLLLRFNSATANIELGDSMKASFSLSIVGGKCPSDKETAR
jgi:hypothetical protein